MCDSDQPLLQQQCFAELTESGLGLIVVGRIVLFLFLSFFAIGRRERRLAGVDLPLSFKGN